MGWGIAPANLGDICAPMDSADRKVFLKQTLLPAARGIGAAITSSSEPWVLLRVQSQKVKDNSEALLPPSGQALAQLLLNFHGGKLDYIHPFSWVPTMPALPVSLVTCIYGTCNPTSSASVENTPPFTHIRGKCTPPASVPTHAFSAFLA